jgi:protein tyrosine phosphatase
MILHLLVLYTCSAGVGCTGTFIVIDNVLEQIEKEHVVDIPGAITRIKTKKNENG